MLPNHKCQNKLERDARDARILKSRVEGLSTRAIAKLENLSQPMVVKILQRHASRFTQELADLAASVLQVQIERLESIQEILWKKAATGDLKALELSIRVSESLRKLAGLDAPQRVQVEGVELKEFQILDVPFQLETPVLSELAAGTPPKQLELKD